MRVESSPQKRVEAHLYPATRGPEARAAGLLPAKPQKGRQALKHASPCPTISDQEL